MAGSFVKVGQHIGALDYLLPEEYVNTMKVLHNRSPQMSLDDIYSVLREKLGKEVSQSLTEDLDKIQTLSHIFSQMRFCKL